MSFAELGLNPSLVQTVTNLGYEAPTPIQEHTIPVLLSGKDLIGQAQTGTGKTAAFALPILEKIDVTSRETQALVLTPTRELAMQVAEALHSYGHGLRGLSVLPVYGGAPIMPQVKRLERGVHVVVGTPGRLIDMLDRRSLKLDTLRLLVLDEADEMLKMGFIDDVEKLLAATPAKRQIALFSATMPPEILRIAKRYMPDAHRVEIEHKTMTAPMIEQRFLNVSESQKLDALTQILELEENDAVLIFRRTKNGAAELAERLDGRGFAAAAMHGDMNQRERENVIKRLRAGQIEIVVATDVAARGLDVEQITHVVNYDIPHDVESYVHRIGRTGRAGRSGMATLFITPRERRMMREIEHFTGSAIKPMKMPTQADVAARRITQLKDTIRKNMAEGDLDMYLQLVEQLAEEGPHDIAEIAAAAARLASTTRPIAVEAPRAAEPRAAASPTAAAAPRARESKPHAAGESVRLSMAVGKRDGIRPADVVGSIANEADIPGRDIGPIDIRDDITYVSVPGEYVEQVLDRVGRAKFRGRPLDLKVATGAPPPRERERERAPRRFDGPPPRKEWQPRRTDAVPRSPARGGAFKPRDRSGPPRFERPTRPGGSSRPGGPPRPDRGGPRKPPKKRY